MEKVIYHKTAAIEDIHWWFIGRRFIMEQIIEEMALPINSEILEMGCGTGGNLRSLAKYGKVFGVELDDIALQYSRKRKIGTIIQGSLPDDIPFSERLFDLIVMTDVLEHVEADQLSLERLYTRLKSGGHILVTVPAFPALWSQHDVLHHHKRRYTMTELRTKFSNAKYCVLKATYFNFFFFPVIAGLRLVQRFIEKSDNDNLVLPPLAINKLLAKIFAMESYLLNFIPLPFGLSLLCVGRKV